MLVKFYIKYHAKAIAALAAPLAVLADSAADGNISSGEAKKVGLALLAPLFAYLFPNAKIEDKPASRASLQAQVDELSAKVKGLGG